MYKTILFLSVLLMHWGSLFSQKVTLQVTENNAVFLEGKDSVLVYQKEPKSFKGMYERANYIHPLFSLEGVPITEDFPQDHLHHRGIFWAWHQLYLNDTAYGDAWEIRDFEWEVVSMSEIKENSMAVTLKSEVIWKSATVLNDTDETRPLVKETNWITVYPKASNYRAIDIKIQLYPLSDTIFIGGSEDEKGYGGFSARVQLSEDVLFKDSEGNITPQNTPVQGNNWIDIVSKTARTDAPYGLTIIPSKDNLDYPNPWILRSKQSMQNAVYPYPGSSPVPLSSEIPLILKYRLIVHDGAIDTATLFGIQKKYFNPMD